MNLMGEDGSSPEVVMAKDGLLTFYVSRFQMFIGVSKNVVSSVATIPAILYEDDSLFSKRRRNRLIIALQLIPFHPRIRVPLIL